MAHEVLELWLEELAESGAEIPAHALRPIIDEVEARAPKKAKILYAPNFG